MRWELLRLMLQNDESRKDECVDAIVADADKQARLRDERIYKGAPGT